MLVSLKEYVLQFAADFSFETPVVGSVKNDKSPTSGDVHLYADPETAYTSLPMLYADCEGLHGGETKPAASKYRERKKKKKADSMPKDTFITRRDRKLAFEESGKEQGKRELSVRNVYPRLLYTFSDVVVFVLRNTRYVGKFLFTDKFANTL